MAPESTNGTLVTQAAAARHLNLTRATLRNWTKAGRVPHIKDPDTKRVRYSIPRLDRWLADNCPSEAA